MDGSARLGFARETLHLLPSCAIWWPAASAVVIADLHLGKAAAFRTHGIPVPAGSTSRDLGRISPLLNAVGAQRLIVLGDFLHAKAGRQPETFDEFSRWRRKNAATQMLLVRGNHDRSAGRVLPEWNIEEVEEPFNFAGLWLMHHPEKNCDDPALAGHVHPVTHLQDYDGSIVKVPSFIVEEQRLILPAFGTFTGGHAMPTAPTRRVFLVMSGRVIERKAR